MVVRRLWIVAVGVESESSYRKLAGCNVLMMCMQERMVATVTVDESLSLSLRPRMAAGSSSTTTTTLWLFPSQKTQFSDRGI